MTNSPYSSSGTSFPFDAADQTRFPGLLWDAGPEPRGVVVAIHGLSGAAADFEPLGIFLSGEGFAVTSYQLRGMGLDPEPHRRGDLRNPRLWLEDLDQFLTVVEDRFPGVPIFLLGESLGALIALEWMGTRSSGNRVRGLILSSPVVELAGDLPWWQDWLMNFLLWVAPGKKLDLEKLGEDSETEDPRVTRDDAYHEYLKHTPHRISAFSLRMLKGIVTLVERSPIAYSRVEQPMLVLYAEHDVFVQPEAIEAFVQKQSHQALEMAYFQDAYHLLFHDPDTPQVVQRVLQWLNRQVD